MASLADELAAGEAALDGQPPQQSGIMFVGPDDGPPEPVDDIDVDDDDDSDDSLTSDPDSSEDDLEDADADNQGGLEFVSSSDAVPSSGGFTFTMSGDADGDGAGGGAEMDDDDNDNDDECSSDPDSSDSYDDDNLCIRYVYGEYGMIGKRKNMEDAYQAVYHPPTVFDNGGALHASDALAYYAVYDGHGGDACAKFLAERMHTLVLDPLRALEPAERTLDVMREAMVNGFATAEAEFLELAAADLIDAGSTAVASLHCGHQMVVANVGDSEAILCRGGEPVSLSPLHNPSKNPDEVTRVKEAGGKLHRNRLAHPTMPAGLCNIAVSRAFGDIMFKSKKYTHDKPSGLIADPDHRAVVLSPTDEFLILACDGVWDVLSHVEATNFVRAQLEMSQFNPVVAAEALSKYAFERGSMDNISTLIIVFEWVPEEDLVAELQAQDAATHYNAATIRRMPASANADGSTDTLSSDTDSSAYEKVLWPGQLDIHVGPPLNGTLRNLPGTRRDNLFAWEPVSCEQQIGNLEVQQYIQQKIRANPANVDAILERPESVSEIVWAYEHLRQLTMELGHLAVLLEECGCSPETCPQMKVGESWQFLCAAHREPQDCCAIDYICHTLDGAAALLNSNVFFPSRITFASNAKQHLHSVARRLYRINAHAYFDHRDAFDEHEQETSLTERFIKLVAQYRLVPPKLRIIPNFFE